MNFMQKLFVKREQKTLTKLQEKIKDKTNKIKTEKDEKELQKFRAKAIVSIMTMNEVAEIETEEGRLITAEYINSLSIEELIEAMESMNEVIEDMKRQAK